MYPVNSELKSVILKTCTSCDAITRNLLKDYCCITPKKIAVSNAWYIIYGSFTDDKGEKQSLSRDMSSFLAL